MSLRLVTYYSFKEAVKTFSTEIKNNENNEASTKNKNNNEFLAWRDPRVGKANIFHFL